MELRTWEGDVKMIQIKVLEIKKYIMSEVKAQISEFVS